VILLHDFSFKSPEELLAGLQKGMTHGQHDMASMDMSPEEMANMPMSSMTMDVNDIEYDAYLANDRTLDDPEVVKVEAGGRILLRIINGATSTGFTINLGKMSGELIAVDGMNILPIKVRTFPISMGQRLDIRLQMPKNALACPILAERENSTEQTGIILAPTNAKILKIASKGRKNAPILDLGLEKRLVSAEPLTEKAATIKAAFELAGTMMPYVWSIKKVGGTGSNAMTVTEGDRVQITLKNNSMMAHPIHLHGHHFQVVSINGKAMKGAVRDTLLLPPSTTASIIFDADNAGKWPLHCHHLYHMATGMMTFVNYKGIS
jgi:FtsP/CotA-like multicopper oxidase with cupredoxin domain